MQSAHRAGFTILELLVTLLVVSALAALTIPAFFSRPEVTLENASILLARDLRTAQNRSAYMAEAGRFEFLESGHGYCFRSSSGEVVQNPSTGRAFLRDYDVDAVFRGVEIVDVEAGGDRAISFDQRGQALEGARITLAYRGDLRTLVVEPGNGRVTLLGSTSGWTDGEF